MFLSRFALLLIFIRLGFVVWSRDNTDGMVAGKLMCAVRFPRGVENISNLLRSQNFNQSLRLIRYDACINLPFTLRCKTILLTPSPLIQFFDIPHTLVLQLALMTLIEGFI